MPTCGNDINLVPLAERRVADVRLLHEAVRPFGLRPTPGVRGVDAGAGLAPQRLGALIWLAYLAIPLVMLVIARRRKDVPFRAVYFLFIAFILTCGFTHFLDVVMFYSPLYRLSGLVKAMTAVASWATVIALVPVLPKALAMRSPEELEREIAERHRAESDLRALHAQLEERVGLRTAELEEAVAALQAENEERKRVERQLGASREQLRLVTDNAPVMLVHCDTERRYKFVNRAYAECLGWTPREVVGR